MSACGLCKSTILALITGLFRKGFSYSSSDGNHSDTAGTYVIRISAARIAR